ncbi:hypothetical protein GGR56DRAFT_675856 [Xylariaceae sp. FL0804]|nr:hypothetical protein GGR56DRAFT_675856 [Xylariaceae sp. FL0804]
MRAAVATAKQIPTSNDGHGDIPLDAIPGMGIVLPGGLNMYYLDVKPNTEGTMHRTTSTDYLVVLSGKLSLMTPPTQAYRWEDGKATSGDSVETICYPGDVIVQRGPMHAGVTEEVFYRADTKETQLVPMGRSKGDGAAGGFAMPSFLVWLIKGRD